MKILLKKEQKVITGAGIDPCPGGWELHEKNTYLKTEKHFKCYVK